MKMPLVTIGILSWNRLHYLRATLESARRCIQYPNLQWIVVDNLSEEPGLAEYLKSCDWIDELVFLKCDHVTAMNEVIARARGEVTLLWPEDVQFIVEGNWMAACVEVLLQHQWLGSLGLNALRRATLEAKFHPPLRQEIRPILSELKWFGGNFRFPRQLTSSQGLTFQTFGWKEMGIIGSGIPSLTRTEVWKTLGPWKAPGATSLNDSSGGGETEMLRRWQGSGHAWQAAIPSLPVAADILTDPLGTKAKVRKNTRYGVYTSPPEGTFYYEIMPQASAQEQLKEPLPLAFEDFVHPIGFELPLDPAGNLLKSGINLEIIEEIYQPPKKHE
jgi:hypothetical protein